MVPTDFGSKVIIKYLSYASVILKEKGVHFQSEGGIPIGSDNICKGGCCSRHLSFISNEKINDVMINSNLKPDYVDTDKCGREKNIMV